MPKFKIETSFQMPFLKLYESVSYTEVEKPTGLAYMILVLINELSNKNMYIYHALDSFNIPSSLHYIFADTILDLINKDILKFKENAVFLKTNFNQMKIKDIAFTEKGAKIFKEEAIPTGIIKEVNIPIFYNIALNELFYTNDNLELKPLMDSAIKDEFIDQFECKKDIEAFLNFTKGTKISIYENGKKVKELIIKKEEVITKVEVKSKENWVGKYDCEMELNEDNVSFNFENLLVKKFFDNYYSTTMINESIGFKNKFKFTSVYSKDLEISKFDNQIYNLLLPGKMKEILNKKYELFISKGNYECNSNSFSINAKDQLLKFSKECEFMTIDRSGENVAYIPGLFKFNYIDQGIINIPLILAIKISDERVRSIVNNYITDHLHMYSLENYLDVLKLCNICDDYKIATLILEGYLKNNSIEENLNILNEIEETSLSNPVVSIKYKELLKANYEAYFALIREENLDVFLKTTFGISKILNMSQNDVLSKIYTSLGDKIDALFAYETLVKYNFDRELVTLYFNPVPIALETKKVDEKTLNELISFDNKLNELKKITNITDFNDYIYNEENIDKAKFKSIFSIAYKSYRLIQIFKKKNERLFINYEKYINIFNRLNDDFSMQEEALKNANMITNTLIENKIISGDYQYVFINLAIKLESILKNKFNLNGNLVGMLNEMNEKKLIDKKIIYDLHKFRENRNAYIHPENRNTNFKSDDLRRWSQEIFELDERGK